MNLELLERSMQKLKNGDIEAFDDIYTITSGTVFILAYSILKNKARAEDVVQETYIRVFKKIVKYKFNTNAAAWISSIARHLSFDELDKSKRNVSLEVFEGNIVNADFDLAESVHLKMVFETLDADEREIVILFAIDSLKHREIAEVVNKPVGTVQWIYNKAIKKLREKMRKEAGIADFKEAAGSGNGGLKWKI